MLVDVIYNNEEYEGKVLYRGDKYWLVNIPSIGDRKIPIEDILEAELSWDDFRELNYR